MVTIQNGKYVVELPEHGLYQDEDPRTGRPFVSQAAAEEWETLFKAENPLPETLPSPAPAEPLMKPLLEISLDKDTARADSIDALTFSYAIRDEEGQIVPFSGEYKILIRDGTGNVAKIVTLTLTDGQGSFTVKSGRAARYALLPEDFTLTRLLKQITFDFTEPVSSGEIIL